MARLCVRYLAPTLLGLAWTHAAMSSLLWVTRLTPHSVGDHTLEAAFYNPVMSVWYLFRLPILWPWTIAPLYAYYAGLTVLLWNAGRGGRPLRFAAAAYAAHVAATLVLTLVCGMGVPIPRLDAFYLLNDLRALLNLTRRQPGSVALFALCLTAWHVFAAACLVRLWTGRRPTP